MSNQTPQKEKKKKDISTQVLAKVETFKEGGQITIPKDYSPANALKSAYLILQETVNKQNQKALDHCTPESVGEALLKMVVWGLSPLKGQCHFIMYGQKLDCSIDYTGNIALAKRYGGLKNIKANAIFEGDDFDFEIDVKTGRTNIIKHKPSLQTLGSKKVVGAYAVMEMQDGSFDAEVMSIQMIQQSWEQGATNGKSPAHTKFPDQMAIKTVINRACKLLIRGSNDSVLYDKEESGEKYIDVVSEDLSDTVKNEANKEPLKMNVEGAQEVKPQISQEEFDDLLQEQLEEEQKSESKTPGF